MSVDEFIRICSPSTEFSQYNIYYHDNVKPSFFNDIIYELNGEMVNLGGSKKK